MDEEMNVGELLKETAEENQTEEQKNRIDKVLFLCYTVQCCDVLTFTQDMETPTCAQQRG